MSLLFSIIIPTYNRANMLIKALDSVRSQTYENWELIVVDDGSTDNTMDIVASYIDDRIKYLWQTNQERSIARNNGIKIAKGDYICFLDSDDYFLPNRLELLEKEIKKYEHKVAFFYTGICFEKDSIIIERTEIKRVDFINIYDFILKAIIGTPQACISKEILLQNNFNPKFRIGEDMELWLRIVNKYPLIYLPNQFTIVATDHEYRSVNFYRNNVYEDVLLLVKYLKSNNNYKFSKQTLREVCSDCYFGISKFFICKDNRFKAILNIIYSIIINIKGNNKYKLNIMLNVLINFKKAKKII